MHPHTLGQWTTGPQYVRYAPAPVAAPAPAPVRTVVRTVTGGTAVSAPPPPVSPGLVYQPSGRDAQYADAAGGSLLPFYDDLRRFQYSREQLKRMRADAAAREITDPQMDPDGAGYELELEQEATNQNATEKAIRDAATGTGMPETGAKKDTNLMPLVLAAAAAYFLL